MVMSNYHYFKCHYFIQMPLYDKLSLFQPQTPNSLPFLTFSPAVTTCLCLHFPSHALGSTVQHWSHTPARFSRLHHSHQALNQHVHTSSWTLQRTPATMQPESRDSLDHVSDGAQTLPTSQDSAFLSASIPYHHLSHLQHPISILIGHFHSDFIVMEDAVERSPLVFLPPAYPPKVGEHLSSLVQAFDLVSRSIPLSSSETKPTRCPLSLLPYPFLLSWIVPACKHTRPQEHPPLALWSHHPIFLLPFMADLLKELVCFLHHHFLFA